MQGRSGKTVRIIKFRQPIFINHAFSHFHYWGFIDSCFIGPETNCSTVEEARKNSMQFTGLHDKNGKEIYSSDLVAIDICTTDDAAYGGYKIIYEVRWTGGHWDIHSEEDVRTEWLEKYHSQCEVIGNIYEHPELLGASCE
jgi:uncharacterized phage protein (TIGR01671 family)